MFKKFLLFSFFIALFNFSSVLAGDAEKGKKLYKKCAACHNAASVPSTKRDQTFGEFTVLKLLFKKVINIQTG